MYYVVILYNLPKIPENYMRNYEARGSQKLRSPLGGSTRSKHAFGAHRARAAELWFGRGHVAKAERFVEKARF